MSDTSSAKTVDLKKFGKLTYKQLMGVVLALGMAVFLTLFGFGASCSCFGLLLIAVLLFMLPRTLRVENMKLLSVLGVIFLAIVLLIGGLVMAPSFVEKNQGNPDVSGNEFFATVEFSFPGGGVEVTATLESTVVLTAHQKVYLMYGKVNGIGFAGTVISNLTESTHELTVAGTTVTGFAALDPNNLYTGCLVIKDESDPNNIKEVDKSRTFYSFFTGAFDGSILKLTLYGCLIGALPIFMFYFTILTLSNFMRIRMEKARIKMEQEGRLYPQGHGRCKQCNSVVLPGEVTCRKCGAYIDRPEEMKPDKKDFFECDECGAEVPEDAKTCPKCGAVFDEEEFEVVHADGKVDTSNELIKCPECGQVSPANTTFCVRCGAKFGKK
ncbi:MAG: zinc ribbon domain-containing protein [Methanomassiliicoccaceae archaeon]|nr:zinc ribbon domain-containing protein [Methanomassiliicoccaceae archaeon]MCL2318352.1 zinc ribbon domain-containing protein [Methanomassiliicoccaceae archaeon]